MARAADRSLCKAWGSAPSGELCCKEGFRFPLRGSWARTAQPSCFERWWHRIKDSVSGGLARGVQTLPCPREGPHLMARTHESRRAVWRRAQEGDIQSCQLGGCDGHRQGPKQHTCASSHHSGAGPRSRCRVIIGPGETPPFLLCPHEAERVSVSS